MGGGLDVISLQEAPLPLYHMLVELVGAQSKTPGSKCCLLDIRVLRGLGVDTKHWKSFLEKYLISP